MKNAKKVINSAFQSGASFGAGLTSLIISFLFFVMASKFQEITQDIETEMRESSNSRFKDICFELADIFDQLFSFVNTLGYILVVIGISLIIIGGLTQYYREKSIGNS